MANHTTPTRSSDERTAYPANNDDASIQPQRWRFLVPHDEESTHTWLESDRPHIDPSLIDVYDLTAYQMDRLFFTLRDIALTSGPYWISYDESGTFENAQAALEIIEPRIDHAFDKDEHDGLTTLANVLHTAVERSAPCLFELGAAPDITRPTPKHPTGDHRKVLIIGGTDGDTAYDSRTSDIDNIFEQPGAIWDLTHTLIHQYDMAVIRDRMSEKHHSTWFGLQARIRMELLANTIMDYGMWCVVNGGVPANKINLSVDVLADAMLGTEA